MIPIWAKDKEGSWEIFPAHLLETLIDGSLGFSFQADRNNGDRSAAFRQFRGHFEWNPIGWDAMLKRPPHLKRVTHYSYRLKKQPANEEMSEKIQAGPGVF